ncbi:MAG TPA: hypothetical protein VN655_17920 [Pseudolabrys sp.]|jgi:hypothetical protein|nr:hypothetical protein [Pseudolabrys sp.]
MTTIGTLDVAHESGVVIYDAKTGAIVHRHEVVTVRGGVHPDAKAIEAEALALYAAARPGAKGKTAVLHFDPRTLTPRRLHKVDVAKRKLVELPVKAAKKRR